MTISSKLDKMPGKNNLIKSEVAAEDIFYHDTSWWTEIPVEVKTEINPKQQLLVSCTKHG